MSFSAEHTAIHAPNLLGTRDAYISNGFKVVKSTNTVIFLKKGGEIIELIPITTEEHHAYIAHNEETFDAFWWSITNRFKEDFTITERDDGSNPDLKWFMCRHNIFKDQHIQFVWRREQL